LNQSPILRFGIFEVDARAGELRKNGTKVKLQQQPLQILLALLARPGEVVTREELRQQLWPADTFVDFEHSLNAAIKRLRDSLGESAEAPVYIETLPRRGYRFLAPVQGTCGEITNDQPPPGSLKTTRSRLIPYFVVALLLAVLSIAWIYRARASGHLFALSVLGSSPPMRVLPFTADPGGQSDPSFSPDGRQVAFVKWDAEVNFNADVYVKLIGGNQPLRLTQDPGWACCTTWSPDALYVAYERCDGPQAGLYLVPALGGPERRLQEAMCLGISWSPDDTQIALIRKDPLDSPYSIFLLDVPKLTLHRVTSPSVTEIGDRTPAFSPDGTRLAFVRVISPWVTDLYVIPVTGGEPGRLTFDNTEISGFAWTADSHSIVFSSHRAGGMSLWKVPVAGGALEAVPIGGSDTWKLDIPRHGNRLAFTVGGIHPNIWQMQLDNTHNWSNPKPLIASTKGEGGPQFSPDGSKIVFYSSRSGYAEIWTSNADGSGLMQLTSMRVLSGTPRWSPDGKAIAFDARPQNHSHIFVIAAQGGEPHQVTTGESENSVPSWSRDGKWIYFTSNRGGGWQLWKAPSAGGDPVQVTKQGGYAGFESQDGRELYYAGHKEPGIWRQPVGGGQETRVVNVPVSWGHWALASRGIYFVDQTGPKPVIEFYNFSDRKITHIATLEKPMPPEEPGLDISPDERTILFLPVVSNMNINLVENFR
jgi:Tol biopolymer transport system component/DNA-binding winged helix-turn-helix (wHTH) protein